MSTPPQGPPPTGPTPADWYPDPEHPGQLRYWDGSQWTDHRSPAQGASPATVESQPGAVNAPLATYSGPPILVSTMNDVPGYRITEVHGEVFGLVVRSRNVLSNVGASFRTVFGGEARGYTQLLSDSRQEAQARLMQAVHDRGGNAVIAMRFDANEIANMMSEIVAYGTAVTIEKLDGKT
jgi:uncharacterized protein YbjQ (UPF0145 family)